MLEQINMGGYIINICAQILGYLWWKNTPQPAKLNIGQPPSKIEKLCRPNIGIWGVYPEAMACNVGRLCWDFNLGECIWRKSHQQPNLQVHMGAVTGFISRYAHTNGNVSTIGQHCRPLPLDRHPTCLCLDKIFFFGFRRRLTNIWLCLLMAIFTSKRPKHLGKYAYNTPGWHKLRGRRPEAKVVLQGQDWWNLRLNQCAYEIAKAIMKTVWGQDWLNKIKVTKNAFLPY